MELLDFSETSFLPLLIWQAQLSYTSGSVDHRAKIDVTQLDSYAKYETLQVARANNPIATNGCLQSSLYYLSLSISTFTDDCGG